MTYKVEYNGASSLWEIKMCEPYLDDRVICLCYTESTANTIKETLRMLGDTHED
jgi:hypothetical protein